MLGSRTELTRVNEFNRQTSDGLMRAKVFKCFAILSKSERLISVEEVQICVFHLGMFNLPCFDLNFA